MLALMEVLSHFDTLCAAFRLEYFVNSAKIICWLLELIIYSYIGIRLFIGAFSSSNNENVKCIDPSLFFDNYQYFVLKVYLLFTCVVVGIDYSQQKNPH